MSTFNKYVWDIVDKYFEEHPYSLTKHSIQSFNDFVKIKLPQLIRQRNPIIIFKDRFENTDEYKYKINIFVGGENGDSLYIGKPLIVNNENGKKRQLYPSEARLADLTYQTDIFIDIIVKFEYRETIEDTPRETIKRFEKINFLKLPIMLHSDFCVLNNTPSQFLTEVGECPYEKGGYFIIDGKEKVIVSQERMTNNKIHVEHHPNDIKFFTYTAEIRCSSEELNQAPETMVLKWNDKLQCIRAFVPYIRINDGLPLFILFRALGIESDKDILSFIVGEEISNNDDYEPLLNLIRTSILDGAGIYNRKEATEYLASLTKKKTIDELLYVLQFYFFPHIHTKPLYDDEEGGSNLVSNFKDKAMFLGYMTKRLLFTMLGINETTDRDRFDFKRTDLAGSIMYAWMREIYDKYTRNARLSIDKDLKFNTYLVGKNFVNVVTDANVENIFKSDLLTTGIQRCLKGKCESKGAAAKQGIVQDLSRVCFLSSLSQLRRLSNDLPEGSKLMMPRKLHGSQWGVVCPVESPEGGNIGLIKHFSIGCLVSQKIDSEPILKHLKQMGIIEMYHINPKEVNFHCKIFLNGRWVGSHKDPVRIVNILRLYRRNGLLSPFVSVYFNIMLQEIHISTEEGRLMRPVFVVHNNDVLIEKYSRKINKLGWMDMIGGFLRKKFPYNYQYQNYHTPSDLEGIDAEMSDGEVLDLLEDNAAVIEYLDTDETNGSLIASHPSQLKNTEGLYIFTHCEIHPSMILGILSLVIPFIEFNQAPRNVLSGAQTKSAVSVYLSNFNKRMDQSSNLLHYSQKPLVSSKYVKYIHVDKMGYGTNVVFAICSYSGFNQEDAFIMNKAALKRGLFSSSIYNTYNVKESVKSKRSRQQYIGNPLHLKIPTKNEKDYTKLDENGIIRVGEFIDSNDIIIGSYVLNDDGSYTDQSICMKRDTFGIVDKVYISNNSKGYRVAKVTIRQIRIPTYGDKFSSRHGQKGTLGIILDEVDIPFTKDGLKPDIIVNPHQITGRMTIAHLLEPLFGKLGTSIGSNIEASPYSSIKNPVEVIKRHLLDNGLQCHGNDILYNGFDGKQIDADIFMGPIYYMRLKHMPIDKINARSYGPRIALTRQPQSGRANEGGLRIGEMERDAIISHGVGMFLKESIFDRSDSYEFNINPQTGYIDNPSDIRDSSVSVHAPYAFKLLMQEVATMGIGMKLITK